MDVAAFAPVVNEDQEPLNFLTMKLSVFAPASISPETKLNVASYVVNTVPEFEIVQYRFTDFVESMPELEISE